jgi:glycosyltransferase involved in cell wall biosynthesis
MARGIPRGQGAAGERSVEGHPPTVSIGVPVYNGARYLPAALDSILGQTFRDLEVIISDNASTDGTEEVCRTYAESDLRVSYIRQPMNRGAALNYNEVFRRSSGRFFKWAAADDVILPEMIERCVEVLEHDRRVAVCFPETLIIDADGAVVRSYDDQLDLPLASSEERFREVLRLIGECNAVFGLIRSEVLRKTRLIGNFVGADTCLLAELSLHGQFVRVPQALFLRRDHSEASSRRRNTEDEMEFYDPQLRGRLAFPTWRALREYARSVAAGPIGLPAKARLCAFLIRGAVSSRNEYIEEIFEALRSR